MNNEHQVEQLLLENDILKKALVKVSFAAVGIHRRLDQSLQQLRQAVKTGDDAKSIQQQVENITKVLREIDDEQSLQKEISTVELLDYLGELLAQELPELEKRIHSIIKKSYQRPLFKTLQNLNNILPQQTKNKPGFFRRFFQSNYHQQNEIDSAFRQQIQTTLLDLLDQLSAPDSYQKQKEIIANDIENIQNYPAVYETINSVASFVLDVKSTDKKHFELFLNQLNQRLDIVQKILQNNSENQLQEQKANESMNTSVRNEMGNLSKEVKDAKDLQKLQQVVTHRLENMIANLDEYKTSHDHFIKSNLDKMKLLNKQLNHSRSDINQLTSQLEKQQHIAETDNLTSLPNRYAFQRKIHEESIRWRRYRNPLSLAMVDVDHFKKVNDTFGHSSGDSLLEQLASILRTESRRTDFVARYGGEEFIIILPETHINQATKAINIIRQKIAATQFKLDQEDRKITVSIGVAEFEDDDEIEQVINRADTALYRAKEKGRNQVCCEKK